MMSAATPRVSPRSTTGTARVELRRARTRVDRADPWSAVGQRRRAVGADGEHGAHGHQAGQEGAVPPADEQDAQQTEAGQREAEADQTG